MEEAVLDLKLITGTKVQRDMIVSTLKIVTDFFTKVRGITLETTQM